MAARAFSLLVAKLHQFWHCRTSEHRAITAEILGRYTRVGCSCGLTFWERAR